MKLKIGIILLLSILALTTYAQDEIFVKINNKTWFEDNGFAGTTLVFYRTSNGLLKAIKQINGSGVPVVGSGIYDVEIIQDTVYLLNGLNLNISEKLVDFNYKYDNKTGLLKPLRIIYEEPIIYTWTDKRKDVNTQIDVRLLSDIMIEKNEIYPEKDLIKTLIDK